MCVCRGVCVCHAYSVCDCKHGSTTAYGLNESSCIKEMEDG